MEAPEVQAFNYINQRKYQAALPVFKKCYEADPENRFMDYAWHLIIRRNSS